jgi:hypothetical protein
MREHARAIAWLTGGLTVVAMLFAEPALAQKPTPAQLDALRANCKGDLAKLCPGVKPGPDALSCLQKNVSRASPGCQTAVNAVK